MPLIDVRLSVPVSLKQEEELVKQIGKAITKIPGKEEASLMVQVQGNCPLWFQGKKQPCAHVTVKIAGQAINRILTGLTRLSARRCSRWACRGRDLFYQRRKRKME